MILDQCEKCTKSGKRVACNEGLLFNGTTCVHFNEKKSTKKHYKCKVCSQEFDDFDVYYGHNMSIHNIVRLTQGDLKIGDARCSCNGSGCINTPSGKRPCPICNKLASNENNMKKETNNEPSTFVDWLRANENELYKISDIGIISMLKKAEGNIIADKKFIESMDALLKEYIKQIEENRKEYYTCLNSR